MITPIIQSPEYFKVIISALLLLTSFAFLVQNRINNLIITFAWQSILLTIATYLQAYFNTQTELYISATITFLLKVLFIPYLLKYFIKKLDIKHKVSTVSHPFLLLMGAITIVIFCYHFVAKNNLAADINTNIIIVAITMILLGMLVLITHHKAISHIIGFMSIENGIFFAALISTNGMSMAVELGIAFDVLIAAVLFGIFFFHMRSSIDTLDVDQLNLLRD